MATCVPDVMRLRAEGYSYRRIAAYLDRKRIPPPRAEHWSAMTVRNMWVREHARQEAVHRG